ncbi:pyridoxamine 5'-phosphate oxidase family protein [Halomicrococcus gelatinilyticus]|uniref:pyridoxamine 5'-phosphate oxidase family protein n=1 Tax=Halomicrococcus gelatinilyticus TaxID=1702103 RepID=UPI002E0D1E3E
MTNQQGIVMEATERTAFLREMGYGTLALARDDEAYAIPMSYGYDGDRQFFFQFGSLDGGTKDEFLETTSRARLVVTEMDGVHEWRSVVAAGALTPVPDVESAEAFERLATDASIPPLRAFGARSEDVEFELVRMNVDELTGYQGTAYDAA